MNHKNNDQLTSSLSVSTRRVVEPTSDTLGQFAHIARVTLNCTKESHTEEKRAKWRHRSDLERIFE